MRRLVWIGLSCAFLALPCPTLAANAGVEFPGTSPVTIPTRFYHGGVFVRVTIAGRSLQFQLDSGAATMTIDPDVAHQLGLPLTNHQVNDRNAHATEQFDTVIPELKIGPLTMHDVAVTAVALPNVPGQGITPVGLLGYDFFATVGITVDYEHQRVTVTPAASYAPPSDPHAVPLEIRLGDQVPMVDVVLDGAPASRFIVDTGDTAGTFTAFDYFIERNPNVGLHSAEQGGFIGVGGYVTSRDFIVRSFRIGPFNFANFTGARVGSGSYPGTTEGLIGAAFLDLFTLDFDYPHRMLYLTPSTLTKQVLHIR